MKIIGCMLVRNEAGRYLDQVLCRMNEICDEIVIVDDASTDHTVKICEYFECKVYQMPESLWGINELIRRKQLWDLATRKAEDGDWILCLDADEIIDGIDELRESISRASTTNADGIAFRLYDMWNKTHYRHDKNWHAHFRPWIMLVRYDSDKVYQWKEIPLHCERFPINASGIQYFTEASILHYGWATTKARQEKYKRYMNIDPNGEYGILAQYESILDKQPNLIKMEFVDGQNFNCKSCKSK